MNIIQMYKRAKNIIRIIIGKMLYFSKSQKETEDWFRKTNSKGSKETRQINVLLALYQKYLSNSIH